MAGIHRLPGVINVHDHTSVSTTHQHNHTSYFARTMAALLTCPNETLINIISYLSTRDLLSVSRASRHFRDISLPLLYKAPFLCASGCYRQPKLPGFMRDLLATPALTFYVQSLEVQLEGWPSAPPAPGTFNPWHQLHHSLHTMHGSKACILCDCSACFPA